ncbi:MAG: Asp-tRNA(Asn)/Glu-tRNA(Gln) amidotransferase subunit GatC [Labilithrix sp.]|nr:Asp-tRNA(Asn)/Glu-tRNA(Gln) amidotransferase subunit GatC [Labilithrix sp.]
MDLAQLRHIAALAELSLSDEEERRFAEEVGKIVAYVAELEAIDTSNVPPTAHVAGAKAAHAEEGWREDRAKPGLSHDDALAGAPRAEHGGFAVPGFIE